MHHSSRDESFFEKFVKFGYFVMGCSHEVFVSVNQFISREVASRDTNTTFVIVLANYYSAIY